MRFLVTLQPFTAAPFPLLGDLEHRIQNFVDAGGICTIWFIYCSFKSLQCWKCVRRIPQGGAARCYGRDGVSLGVCGHRNLSCYFSVGVMCWPDPVVHLPRGLRRLCCRQHRDGVSQPEVGTVVLGLHTRRAGAPLERLLSLSRGSVRRRALPGCSRNPRSGWHNRIMIPKKPFMVEPSETTFQCLLH